jgi:hypothetical protein
MTTIIQGKKRSAPRINDIDSELVILSETNHHPLDTSIIGEPSKQG